MRERFITSDPLVEALAAAGMFDLNTTRRVVIDCQVGHVPVLYIESYGDERVLKIADAVASATVVRVERDGEAHDWRAPEPAPSVDTTTYDEVVAEQAQQGVELYPHQHRVHPGGVSADTATPPDQSG